MRRSVAAFVCGLIGGIIGLLVGLCVISFAETCISLGIDVDTVILRKIYVFGLIVPIIGILGAGLSLSYARIGGIILLIISILTVVGMVMLETVILFTIPLALFLLSSLLALLAKPGKSVEKVSNWIIGLSWIG